MDHAALLAVIRQFDQMSKKRLIGISDKGEAWPVGHTCVYGTGCVDGPRVVQQPYSTGLIALLIEDRPAGV